MTSLARRAEAALRAEFPEPHPRMVLVIEDGDGLDYLHFGPGEPSEIEEAADAIRLFDEAADLLYDSLSRRARRRVARLLRSGAPSPHQETS